MKHPLIAMGLIGLLGTAPVVCWTPSTAQAANSNIEAALQNVDVSMFHQAFENSGVADQLTEDGHYTIFAPVNSAFSQLTRDRYPCFYAEQCRPQIAEVVRNHILVGRYDLTDLITYGSGIQSTGDRRLHVTEPFHHDYAVEGYKILSATEIGGNVVYRIDTVIAKPDQLAFFETVPTVAADTVTEQTTVVKKIYRTPAEEAGVTDPVSGTAVLPGSASQTTTITHTFTTEPR